ncbi:VOC family protein [Nocardia sp. NPDC052278]|uniref:VOC family protein n=1 Tax=unclassified Nocardia TaxID=2637762 RepID=UPI0036AB87A0
MPLGINKIRQVKLPVSNLAKSVAWYRQLLDLEPVFEFYEEDAVRGVVLLEPNADLHIGLRERAYCASHPHLNDFDAFALKVDSLETFTELIKRAEELGAPHGEIHDRGPYGAALDISDPDGTVIRFLYEPDTYPTGFAGLEFGPDGTPIGYEQPRLSDKP